MLDVIREAPPEVLDALTALAKELLENQKQQEELRYRDLLVSPSDAADIVDAAGGGSMLLALFAEDALRYYRAKHVGEMLPEFEYAFLVECGKIIGIRQERAKKRRA